MSLQPVWMDPHRKLSREKPILDPFYSKQMKRHIRPSQQVICKKRQRSPQNNTSEAYRSKNLFPPDLFLLFAPLPDHIQQRIKQRQKYQHCK